MKVDLKKPPQEYLDYNRQVSDGLQKGVPIQKAMVAAAESCFEPKSHVQRPWITEAYSQLARHRQILVRRGDKPGAKIVLKAMKKRQKHEKTLYLDRVTREASETFGALGFPPAINVLAKYFGKKAPKLLSYNDRSQFAAPLLSEGKALFSLPEKLQAHTDHLQKVFEKDEDLQPIPDEVRSAKLADIDSDLSDKDIKRAIAQLRDGKSPGEDGLTAEHLRLLDGTNFAVFKDLVREFWESASLSGKENFSLVKVLPKTATANDPSLFRPVMLIQLVPKVIARILHHKIGQYADTKVLDEWQNGFRPYRRGTDNVFSTREAARSFYWKKEGLVLLYLDIRKAFDSVSREHLFAILRRHSCPQRIIDLVASLYRGHSFSVREGDVRGPATLTGRGVRQGCPLSPLLFALILQEALEEWQPDGCPQGVWSERDAQLKGRLPDLPEVYDPLFEDPLVDAPLQGSLRLNCLGYADDLVLFFSSMEKAQGNLDVLNSILKKYGLRLNNGKCKYQIISTMKKYTLPSAPLVLEGKALEEHVYTLAKYFGKAPAIHTLAKYLGKKAPKLLSFNDRRNFSAPITYAGKTMFTVPEKLEAHAENLNNIFKKDEFLPPISTTVTSEKLAAINTDLSDKDIEDAIKSLRNKRSPGEDGLTAEHIKYLDAANLSTFRESVREVWENRSFDSSTNYCLCRVLPKSPGETSPEKFRPIMLVQLVPKIIARILHAKIAPVADDYLLEEWQNGFRAYRRGCDNIFTTKQAVRSHYWKKESLILLYLDIAKAFDSVSREHLYAVLQRHSCPQIIIDLIISLYKDHSFAVREGTSRSQTFFTGRGVRQGCPLSPLLFSLILNEAFLEWDPQGNPEGIWTKSEPQMGGPDFDSHDQIDSLDYFDQVLGPMSLAGQIMLCMLGYADDIALFFKSMEQAQSNLDTINLILTNVQIIAAAD